MAGHYFRYGNYQHEAGEVTLSSLSSTVEFSDRGIPIKRKFVWAIQGVIVATDAATLTAALQDLEAAYAKQGQNAGLFESSGRATAHVLNSSQALGGVRSHGVSYPDGGNVEYVTSRTYSVTLEADYPITDTAGVKTLEFNETLSFTGTGGPRFIYLFPITGPPEKQTVQQNTTVTIVQSGSSTGRKSYPPVPPPLLPADEHIESRQITMVGPKNQGGDKTEYGMQWSYTFETTSTPTITPHT